MFKLLINPLLISVAALLYAVCFLINTHLMAPLEFSIGVNWIFLPAGLRLLLTLLLGFNGAFGISLASTILGVCFYFPGDPLTAIGAGIISGVAPYVAKRLSFRDLDITTNLANLNGAKLLNCVFIYSLTSPALHQAWFQLRGLNHGNFVENLGVMVIGDLIGTAIIIYLAKGLIFLVRKNQSGL
jgi:hypothetical protein